LAGVEHHLRAGDGLQSLASAHYETNNHSLDSRVRQHQQYQ
jgi:hypothetical protein